MKQKVYRLETYALPAPSGGGWVGEVEVKAPEGHELHSWRAVAAEEGSPTVGFAAVLWEKTS